MAFHNLSGGKELNTHKSTAYKKLVIQYLQSLNYILVKDSDHHATTSDLIFRRIQVDGNKETHVEAKDTNLSLSNKKFIEEIAKYLRIWKNRQGIYFFIFVSKCVNQRKWDIIFDETKQKEDSIRNFYKEVLDNAPENIKDEIKNISFEEFENFIRDSDVYQSNYIDLIRETERANEVEHFNVDINLLDDNPCLVNRFEELIVNGIGLHQDRIPLYIGNLNGKVSKEKLFHLVGTSHLSKDFIISLDPIPNVDEIKKYVDINSIKKIKYSKWSEDDSLKSYCLKVLLKKHIIYRFKEKGAQFSEELDLIYFPHPKAQENEHRYVQKRYVARSFFKDGKLNFVRHRAISVKINFMEDEFLAFFNIHQLFSKDGCILITGNNATKLHQNFKDINANNGMERSLVKYWINIFRFYKSKTNDPIRFLAQKKIKFPYQYDGGKQFTESLNMFFPEDKNEI